LLGQNLIFAKQICHFPVGLAPKKRPPFLGPFCGVPKQKKIAKTDASIHNLNSHRMCSRTNVFSMMQQIVSSNATVWGWLKTVFFFAHGDDA